MDKPTITLIFITLGLVYLGMVKIAALTGAAAAMIFYSGKEKSKSKSSKSSDFKVQPIKVKRKWDEDVDSIYPKKMNIVMATPRTGISDDLEDSLEGIGEMIGKTAKKIKDGS